jgi:hypothetical protein
MSYLTRAAQSDDKTKILVEFYIWCCLLCPWTGLPYLAAAR